MTAGAARRSLADTERQWESGNRYHVPLAGEVAVAAKSLGTCPGSVQTPVEDEFVSLENWY